MPYPKLLRERLFVEAVIADADGRVLHSAVQQDDPVVMMDYDDGMRHLVSKRTGQLIIAPFDPNETERARCPHCHKELGGPP